MIHLNVKLSILSLSYGRIPLSRSLALRSNRDCASQGQRCWFLHSDWSRQRSLSRRGRNSCQGLDNLPVTIETGGEPSISTYRSHRVAEASQIVSTISGSVRARLIASGITCNNSNVKFVMTHSALMYRHLTRQFVRDRVEILHCAEAYQLTGATPTAVQYCPTQGIKEVNNSHQFCAQFSLMWHKPDGSLIPLNQKDQYLPARAGQPRQLNPTGTLDPLSALTELLGAHAMAPTPTPSRCHPS